IEHGSSGRRAPGSWRKADDEMAEGAMRVHAARCGNCAVNGDYARVSGPSCGSAATACDAYLVEIRGWRRAARSANDRPMSSKPPLLCLSVLAACASAPSETRPAAPAPGATGIDLVGMDRTAKPGDDFWAYANGGWLKTHE